jgi:hypothetical protein
LKVLGVFLACTTAVQLFETGHKEDVIIGVDKFSEKLVVTKCR